MGTRIEASCVIARRIARGWWQCELAEASGLSPQVIRRVESGMGASPETLDSLAATQEVTRGELMPKVETDGPSLGWIRLAIGGVLLGYGCAFGAVSYTFYTSSSSGWRAVAMLGALSLATGVLCVAQRGSCGFFQSRFRVRLFRRRPRTLKYRPRSDWIRGRTQTGSPCGMHPRCAPGRGGSPRPWFPDRR